MAAGYQVTDSRDWLGLTAQERAIVGMRVNLALEIERIRKDENLTQETIAKRIGTKQSGVARILTDPLTR